MLEVSNLSREYVVENKKGKKRIVKAVNNVSFILEDDKNYALVGESGSGKSTLARLLLYLEKPTTGKVKIDNTDLAKMSKKELREKRADLQMVTQDGQSSLDPGLKIYDSIAEPIRNFWNMDKKREGQKIESLLEKVELPLEFLDRLPHELSGGQQKRVCIARAISINPELIIFDEAVSGLDVTTRKKILNLLLKLRDEINSTYLFITHNIDVATYMAKNIFVMKQGKIVEKVEEMNSLADFQSDYSLSLINSLLPTGPIRRV